MRPLSSKDEGFTAGSLPGGGAVPDAGGLAAPLLPKPEAPDEPAPATIGPPSPSAGGGSVAPGPPSPRAAWETSGPVALLLLALVALGLWMRLNAFGYPQSFQFDEHHFVENARNYLNHRADWNDHPPLGKLILAISIRLGGDNSVVWRLPSLLFGLVTIIVGAFAAARLFRGRAAGLFAAAFLSADGFMVAYSRAALLDGFLATGAALALLLCSFELSLVTAVAGGVLLGLAASIKFSGVAVALPLLAAWSVQQKWTRRRGVLAACAIPVAALTVAGLYQYGLAVANQPHSLIDVANDIRRLVSHHAELTDMKNPATSGWATWALPLRPLRLGTSEKAGVIRVLSSLGNLAIWWTAVLLALATLASVASIGTRAMLAAPSGSGRAPAHGGRAASWWALEPFLLSRGRAVLVILACVVGFLAPWVLTHRDSYLYHFLPSYTALVILLAGFVAWVQARSARVALVFTVVVLLVAAYYAPIWSYLPLTAPALRARLFLPSW